MNQHTDVETVLERWFDDGPTSMPDRVATVVADRIDRQRQRRAWRLPWRLRTMNLPIKLAGAALAVVLIAIAGYSLLPATSGLVGGPAPSAPISPSPSSSRSPSSSPSPAAARYTVTTGPDGTTVLHAPIFDVPLSIAFGAEWKISAIDRSLVDLVQDEGYTADMGIHSLAMVTLPGATLTDPWVPVPADFIGWVEQRSEWVASAPRTVTIAGRRGTLIDADFVWTEGTAARDFLRYGTGAWRYDKYDAESRVRFIILPGSSGVGGLVIVLNAKKASFDAVATSLDAILASLQFDAPVAGAPS